MSNATSGEVGRMVPRYPDEDPTLSRAVAVCRAHGLHVLTEREWQRVAGERDHARFMSAGWRRLARKAIRTLRLDRADLVEAERALEDVADAMGMPEHWGPSGIAWGAQVFARVREDRDTLAAMVERVAREVPEPRTRDAILADLRELLGEVGL